MEHATITTNRYIEIKAEEGYILTDG